jgi:hypothetical protein
MVAFFSEPLLPTEELDAKEPPKEQFLWHGSRGTNPMVIAEAGLDGRLSNAGFLGLGIYLTNNPL